MNYLKEILAFENWKRFNSAINKSDIGLWYTLMAIANRFNWEEFTVPISTLILESRLNQSAIYRARNKLKPDVLNKLQRKRWEPIRNL